MILDGKSKARCGVNYFPRLELRVSTKEKECQVSLGNGLGRGGKKRLFAHSTEWQSGWDICYKRCANGPHLGIWVRHLDLSVSSCYKTLLRTLESQMREKLGHSHISAPAEIEGLFSGSILSSSWQDPGCLVPLLSVLPEHGIVFVSRLLRYRSPLYSFSQENPSSLHWCKILYVSGMTHICTTIARSSSTSPPL